MIVSGRFFLKTVLKLLETVMLETERSNALELIVESVHYCHVRKLKETLYIQRIFRICERSLKRHAFDVTFSVKNE